MESNGGETRRFAPPAEEDTAKAAWNQPHFVPGRTLSQRFYQEAVRPLLTTHFPGLAHSAALVGSGSDVLGLDNYRSRDHDWGPRMQLFLPEDFSAPQREALQHLLADQLPRHFLGYSTHFSNPNLADKGTRMLADPPHGPLAHKVDLLSLPDFLDGEFGPGWRDPQPLDWLLFSSQRLLAFTGGGVWHDDLGVVNLQRRLAWYPRDVWLYLLASLWQAIGQEEHFLGRTAERGDDLGLHLLTARLAQVWMQMAFLLEQRYAPYSKWFGTAFATLPLARDLAPHLHAALIAADFPLREGEMIQAGLVCLQRLNELQLCEPFPLEAGWFFGRPFRVLHGEEVAARLRAQIHDRQVRGWPLTGSPDQFSANTDLLSSPALRQRLAGLYRPR